MTKSFPISQYWFDALIALLLGVAISVLSFKTSELIPTVIFNEGHGDIWFETDTPRVYENMSTHDSDHSRDRVHPLFSLISYPLVFITKRLLHTDPYTAVRLVIAGIAFIWICACFALLRLMGCQRLDSLLFSLLAMLSGASIFYFAVPETYSFASITILLALIFTVLTQQRTFSNLSYVAINMLTLSITTTNWMLGILSTWVNQRLKNTVQIMINAFFGVTVLWGIQKAIFPTSTFLLDISGERSFIFRAQTGGPLQVAESFFYHTLIVPTIRVVEEKGRPKWPGMYTQTSAPGSGTEYGIIAVLLWTILLTLGIWALFNLKNNQKLRMVLGASLLLQLILHIFYGTEIFVYSLHFIALLIPLAALATLTRARPFVLALTTVLILLVASNNLTQFYKAIDFFRQHGGIPHA